MSFGYTKRYAEAFASLATNPGWVASYNREKATARAAFGDRGDYFIDPIKRRKIRAERRKARKLPSMYMVGEANKDARTRYFKTRKGATKYYLVLKASGRGPWIANRQCWSTVFVTAAEKPIYNANLPVLIVKPNSEMTTRAKLLPKVSLSEIIKGPVIENVARTDRSRSTEGRSVSWPKGILFKAKRLEFLKDLPVVRGFLNEPTYVQHTLMAFGALAVLLMGMAGNLLATPY